MSSEETQALDVVAGLAEQLVKLGGRVGVGALAVAAILRTTSAWMKHSGEGADDIIAKIKAPRVLKSWQELGAEAATVLEKKKAPKG